MEIEYKYVIPIRLTPENVKQAIEDFVRKNDPKKKVVFPKEYAVRFYGEYQPHQAPVLVPVDHWPDVSINIELVEPKVGRPKGRKTKAPVLSGEGFQQSTEYESIPATGDDPLAPLREVYEKYKHLDTLLLDTWMERDGFLVQVRRDLWQAIKKAVAEDIHCAMCGEKIRGKPTVVPGYRVVCGLCADDLRNKGAI